MRRRKTPNIFEEEDMHQSRGDRRGISGWFIFFLVLMITAGAGFGYVYYSYVSVARRASTGSAPPAQQADAQKNLQDAVEKIGRHILLPTGETPVLATVMDAEKLSQDQPFYKDAQNGDEVLVYFNAKKAFLYDPNRDIIVNVGPLILGNASTTPKTAMPPATSTPKTASSSTSTLPASPTSTAPKSH